MRYSQCRPRVSGGVLRRGMPEQARMGVFVTFLEAFPRVFGWFLVRSTLPLTRVRDSRLARSAGDERPDSGPKSKSGSCHGKRFGINLVDRGVGT